MLKLVAQQEISVEKLSGYFLMLNFCERSMRFVVGWVCVVSVTLSLLVFLGVVPLLIVVGFPLLLALFCLGGRAYIQKNLFVYQLEASDSIDELRKVCIGGVDQYLHIRGSSKENPLLLFLHGGPGAPNIGWFDAIQRPWERHFTVVQWDQRQTGKSYASMKKIGHTMTHQQLIADTEEVIQHLLEVFKQKKLFLMGTSYGTYLGMHIVKHHPEWLYAYVGVGQVVNMMEHAREEHALLLQYAVENKEEAMAKKLDSMLPFPDPDNRSQSFFSNIYYLLDRQSKLGKCYPVGIQEMIRFINLSQTLSPLYSCRDIWNKYFGDRPAITHGGYSFAEKFMDYDLPTDVGCEFDIPVFFFTGIDDWHVSSQITDRWFQELKAPFKEQIWFMHSAHVPYITQPTEFAMALITKVLPFFKNQRNEFQCAGGEPSEK